MNIPRLLFQYEKVNDETIELTFPYYESSVITNATEVYEIYNIAVYEEICRALNNNKRVFVPIGEKNLTLTIGDITFKDKDTFSEFEMEKDRIIRRAKSKIITNDYVGSVLSPMLDFVSSSFELMNNGYFITEDNKNDTYYKIISDSTTEESGDRLLKILEKYLDSRNTLEKNLEKYKGLNVFLERLEYADTPEELKEIYEEYKKGDTN